MSIHETQSMSPSRRRELVQRFNEPEDNYQLLHENAQGQKNTGSVMDRLDTNGILQKYVQHTDKMIGVADGSIAERSIYDPVNPERSTQKPDTIIFLDKSARPVADFMNALWEQLAKEGAEMPDFEFLNIDRVNWFMDQGYRREEAETILGPHDFDIDKVEEEDIARIRALFTIGDLSEDNWQEEVMSQPTILDGKNILIVDEVKSQGGTLSIATQLLRRAIPESTVSGEYFWETSYTQMADGKNKADSVPVWYSKQNTMGRGIGDISKVYYEAQYKLDPSQENLRRKIGWSVLSAPHFIMDENGEVIHTEDRKHKTLLQDIAFLSYGLGAGRILYSPDSGRSDEEQEKIYEEQDITPREAGELRRDSKRLRKQQETADNITEAQAKAKRVA